MAINTFPSVANQPLPRTGQAFLRRIHGPDWTDIWVATYNDMGGGRAGPNNFLTSFPVSTGHYYSSAHIKPGATTRSNATFESLWAVVLDDVGTKVDLDEHRMLLPEPTAIIETSQGNFQWVYALSTPEPDADKVSAAFAALKRDPVLAEAFDGTGDLTHYFRLPDGVNPKPDRDNSFKTICTEFDAANRYEFDELMLAFGIDLPAAMAAAPPRAPTGASEQVPVARIRAMFDLLPNNFDREAWLSMAHAVAAATQGEPVEARDAFVAWSATHVPKDGRPPAEVVREAERVWDTLGDDHKAGAGTLRKHLEQGATRYKDRIVLDPAGGFAEEIDEARAATAIVGKPGSDPSPEEIDDLFKRLREARPIHPDYDEPEPGGDWLDPQPRTSFPIRPIIAGGFLRGSSVIIAGAPGGGKSSFSLLLSLALAHEQGVIAGLQSLRLPGASVIISNEDPPGEVERRIAATETEHKLDGSQRKHPVRVLSGSMVRRSSSGVFVLTAGGRDFLEKLIAFRAKHDIALIVIDTLITAAKGAEENSPEQTQEIMDFMRRLARNAWASVLVLQHPPKSAWDDDATKRALSSIRGSGNLAGSVRSAYGMSTPTAEERKTFGWTEAQGKDIAVLESTKASWLRIGTKLFFNKIARGLPSHDPLQPGVGIADEETVVLMPFAPVAPTLGTLVAQALQKVAARLPDRVSWNANAGSAGRRKDAFEKVTGLDRDKAEEVIGVLLAAGRIVIQNEKIGSNMVGFVTIVGSIEGETED